MSTSTDSKPDTVYISGCRTGGSRTLHQDSECYILMNKANQIVEKDKDLLWDSATWCGVCSTEHKQ